MNESQRHTSQWHLRIEHVLVRQALLGSGRLNEVACKQLEGAGQFNPIGPVDRDGRI